MGTNTHIVWYGRWYGGWYGARGFPPREVLRDMVRDMVRHMVHAILLILPGYFVPGGFNGRMYHICLLGGWYAVHSAL